VTREHTPGPGTTWETAIVRNEVVVDTTDDQDHNAPTPARPNRATRRAAARAQRKASR
jgi:hypothetical protein